MSSSLTFCIILTGGAQSGNREVLQVGCKMVLRLDLLHQRPNSLWGHTDQPAALAANQVDVGSVLVGYIKRLPVPQAGAADQAFRHQRFQGAVDGSDIYRAGAVLDLRVDHLHSHMVAGGDKRLDDHFALGGDAVAALAQLVEEGWAVGHNANSFYCKSLQLHIVYNKKACLSRCRRGFNQTLSRKNPQALSACG